MQTSSTAGALPLRTPSTTKRLRTVSFSPGDSATLRGTQRQRAAEAMASADADAKVERHRFAQFVLREAPRCAPAASAELFVESMLRELAAAAPAPAETRAAAASWGMKLLCRGRGAPLMEALVAALFPAVFCEYDERKLEYAPAAVQTLLNDHTLVRDNPFFTHVMYMQKLPSAHAEIAALKERLECALDANAVWCRFATLLVGHAQWVCKRRVLLSWRHYVRRRRVDAFLRRSVVRRHERMLLVSRMRAAFFQWKAIVEVSRSEYLTERLHEAAFQLEGAKERFELQCLHAERLQESHACTREELRNVSDERDALRRRVNELTETMALRNAEYEDRLAARMRDVLSLLQRQRQTIEMAVATRFDASAPWLSEDNEKETEKEKEKEKEKGHALLLRWCNSVLSSVEGMRPTTVTNFAVDFADGQVYNALLCHVCPAVRMRPLATGPLKGLDLRNRLARLCNVVRDETQMHTALEPDDFICRREDKIVVAVAELFMRHLNETAASQAREALAFIGLSPNKNKNTNQTSHTSFRNDGSNKDTDAPDEECSRGDEAENSAASLSCSSTQSDERAERSDANDRKETAAGEVFEADALPPPPPDEAALCQSILSWNEELRSWDTALRSCIVRENTLYSNRAAIASETAHFIRQRAMGQPVYIVTPRAAKRYVAVSASLVNDLRAQFHGTDPSASRATVREEIHNTLLGNISHITRIFHKYAGADARQMSEVQFWRFIEESNVLTKPLTALAVSQIFDEVASPQLVQLARSNARNDAEQRRVAEVIQDEVNVRFLRPSQFTEILVRMAAARFPGSPILATKRFFAALKWPESMPPYTLRFYEPEVQETIAQYQQDLSRIFFFYMRSQINASVAGRSRRFNGYGRYMAHMNSTTYLRIFADCDFLSSTGVDKQNNGFQRGKRFITENEVNLIFEKIQGRIPDILPGEMCFSLFLETLGVVCVYWCPDSTIPLSRRLGSFIASMIERLCAFHDQTTLLLPKILNVSP